MSELDDLTLDLWLDGELPEEEAQRVAAAVAGDEALAARVELLRRTRKELQAAFDRERRAISGDLTTSRERLVAPEASAVVQMIRRRRRWRRLGLIGVVLLLLAGGALGLMHLERRPFVQRATRLMSAPALRITLATGADSERSVATLIYEGPTAWRLEAMEALELPADLFGTPRLVRPGARLHAGQEGERVWIFEEGSSHIAVGPVPAGVTSEPLLGVEDLLLLLRGLEDGGTDISVRRGQQEGHGPRASLDLGDGRRALFELDPRGGSTVVLGARRFTITVLDTKGASAALRVVPSGLREEPLR